jgi:hypothetical protein
LLIENNCSWKRFLYEKNPKPWKDGAEDEI